MAATGAGGRFIETQPRLGIGLREILLQQPGLCRGRIVELESEYYIISGGTVRRARRVLLSFYPVLPLAQSDRIAIQEQ
jgi:hypothetical protein